MLNEEVQFGNSFQGEAKGEKKGKKCSDQFTD